MREQARKCVSAKAERRERLERDTATYFENLSPEAAAEEAELAAASACSTRGIDFDREP
jgi:hypothetical protein